MGVIIYVCILLIISAVCRFLADHNLHKNLKGAKWYWRFKHSIQNYKKGS